VISATFRRAEYLENFSAAGTKVQAEIPHQKGVLLSESISFALIQRIPNQNKRLRKHRETVQRFTIIISVANVTFRHSAWVTIVKRT
jgi:hypothetical protein